jgi:hypothetical protein
MTTLYINNLEFPNILGENLLESMNWLQKHTEIFEKWSKPFLATEKHQDDDSKPSASNSNRLPRIILFPLSEAFFMKKLTSKTWDSLKDLLNFKSWAKASHHRSEHIHNRLVDLVKLMARQAAEIDFNHHLSALGHKGE